MTFQRADEALTVPLTLPPRSRAGRVAATIMAHSGDIYIWGAFAAAGWLFAGPSWKTLSVATLGGLALCEIVVIGIKNIFRRQRPSGTGGLVYRKADPYSFPSGHAARAIMLTLLAWQYGSTALWVGILAWGLLMVLSRIAIGIHYVFDVLGGFLLGWLLALVVFALAPIIVPLL